jgi:oligopeptide/dipeptide ABC transporter ATP-binding protein
MPLLEVHDLHTQFDTGDGVVRAVDGVSFHLDAGETLGLVGESGCGKSVTALSLMRLVSPKAGVVRGRIMFDGRDILAASSDELRRIRGNTMAMVFQDPMTSLNPLLTVGRQVSEALTLHLGLGRAEARDRTVELLRLVGIPGAAKRLGDYPHQFSGGMRQRVMIAMAMSCNPKLILADEITTALDVTIQAQILDLVGSLAQESGTAFLLITHDLGIVAGMTQRVHVMYAGRIVEKADTLDLFSRPKMPYTWGLLRSIPRLRHKATTRLAQIEGRPPDLKSIPPGCRFQPRCQYRRPICAVKEPELTTAAGGGPGQEVRCWGTQEVPGGGWLIDTDWRVDGGDPVVIEQIREEAAAALPGPDAGAPANAPGGSDG